jgi:hypothetical protein
MNTAPYLRDLHKLIVVVVTVEKRLLAKDLHISPPMTVSM